MTLKYNDEKGLRTYLKHQIQTRILLISLNYKIQFILLKSMKKFLATFLAIIFLLNTSGLCVVINYCPMKKDFTVSLDAEKSCCCTAKDGTNNCCTSHQVELKNIKDNFLSTGYHFLTANFEFSNYYLPATAFLFSRIIPETCSYADFKPPDPPGLSLNLLFGVFLI